MLHPSASSLPPTPHPPHASCTRTRHARGTLARRARRTHWTPLAPRYLDQARAALGVDADSPRSFRFGTSSLLRALREAERAGAGGGGGGGGTEEGLARAGY